MAKSWSAIGCKCGFKTKVEYRKPDYFTPTRGVFTCEMCGSRSKFEIKKIVGKKSEVHISHVIFEPTKELLELIGEENVEKLSGEIEIGAGVEEASGDGQGESPAATS